MPQCKFKLRGESLNNPPNRGCGSNGGELMCALKRDRMTMYRSLSLWSLVAVLNVIQLVRPWLML